MDVGGKLCKRKKPYTLYGDFKIHGFRNSERLIGRYGNASATISATRNKIEPGKVGRYNVQYDQIEFFDIKYYATNTGHEHMEVVIYGQHDQYLGQALPLDFDVIDCSTFGVHGTADMGTTANALSPGSEWNFVGTYDVAGKFKVNEDGSTNGQGTSNMFMDGIATAPQVSCEFTSLIQGNTGLEVEADPNAWANDGTLNLQIHLESMPVNFGGIGCTSFGGTWNTGSVALTVASFDLNLPPLPAEGGTTSLEFQLPGQPGEFKMDLIVVPVDAES
jgi:hypothetical protein